MKIFQALKDNSRKRDNASKDRLENNRVRTTIEDLCEKYLMSVNDVLEFEALPSALDATLAVLDSKQFTEKYEYAQSSETLFLVRLREIELW